MHVNIVTQDLQIQVAWYTTRKNIEEQTRQQINNLYKLWRKHNFPHLKFSPQLLLAQKKSKLRFKHLNLKEVRRMYQ